MIMCKVECTCCVIVSVCDYVSKWMQWMQWIWYVIVKGSVQGTKIG